MQHTLLASAIALGLPSTPPTLAQAGEGSVEGASDTLSARHFCFNPDNRGGAASPSKSKEWGQGFLLNFQSGYTAGPVGFGLDALGQVGIRLDSGGRTTKADRDRNPGALFPLEDDGSAVS